jgi:hypothetical protein
MPFITITTIDTQENGHIAFNALPDSDFRSTSVRVSRTPTLDGGSVIDHRGFTDGDRSFEIRADLSEAEADLLWYMYRAFNLVRISCKEGVFSGVISEMKDETGLVTFTFLVKESLT